MYSILHPKQVRQVYIINLQRALA